MNYRGIIADAWRFTRVHKSLIYWFALIPAMIHVVAVVIYMSYQLYSLVGTHYLGMDDLTTVMGRLWNVASEFAPAHPGAAVFLLVLLVIFALAYFLLPTFCQGALIQWIAKVHAGEELTMMDGIGLGFRRFLQYLEYELAVRSVSIVSIATEGLFVLKSFGPSSAGFFVALFSFLFVIGMILTLLFTYSEFFIVLEDRGVFPSMIASSGLVVRHWHRTLFMLLLMVMITVRMLLNIAVAMLIPFLVLGPILLFASIALTWLGVILGVILGLVALYFASYFVGVFHVFSTAVWTFAFEELKAQ